MVDVLQLFRQHEDDINRGIGSVAIVSPGFLTVFKILNGESPIIWYPLGLAGIAFMFAVANRLLSRKREAAN